jgi:hypothetical protein
MVKQVYGYGMFKSKKEPKHTSSAGLDDDDFGFAFQLWTISRIQVFEDIVNGELVGDSFAVMDA